MAAIITVDSAIDSGNGFCTLRQALLSASLNVSIAGCAAGDDNVVDDVDIDVAGPIILTGGQIEIFGAVSIVPTGVDLVHIQAAPNSRIFRVNSPDSNDNDFIINNLGFADGDVGVEDGGAILIVDAGEVIVVNSQFVNNQAENGGAINGDGSTVNSFMLLNNQFINNSATNSGGALFGENIVGQGIFDIKNNNFKGNTANFGGALYINDAGDTYNFFFNKFTSNVASIDGGAVYFSALTGGQVYDMDSNLFYNNQAVNAGGAIRLFLPSARLNLINSTLSQNNADIGGAISNAGGNLSIRTSTLVYNTAISEGANIHSSPQGINSFGHSIVAHPRAQDNCGGANASFFSFGANVSDDASCGFNELSDTLGDPKLTGLVEVQDHYAYFPTADSPALDNSHLVVGLCHDSSSAPISLDQFGTSRNMDGDGDMIGQCDAGAIEATANTDLIFYDSFGVSD